MSVKYNIIVAATEEGGIGLKNDLPWKLKGDMKYFKDVTTGDDKGTKCLFFFLERIVLNELLKHSENQRCHHGKKDMGLDS